jgi:phosphate transport system permease protein
MPKNGMTEGYLSCNYRDTLFGFDKYDLCLSCRGNIYMNEYVSGQKKIIKQMTNNLAGVPSIVFGLFGMALFVNKLVLETRSLPVD